MVIWSLRWSGTGLWLESETPHCWNGYRWTHRANACRKKPKRRDNPRARSSPWTATCAQRSRTKYTRSFTGQQSAETLRRGSQQQRGGRRKPKTGSETHLAGDGPLQSVTQPLKRENPTATDKLKIYLLGLPAITALNLAVRIEATVPTEEYNPIPKCFQRLRKFQWRVYHYTQTRCNSTCTLHISPYTTTSPTESARRGQVNGVHPWMSYCLKVDEPTSWCAGVVVVPKKNGQVHGPNHTILHQIQQPKRL